MSLPAHRQIQQGRTHSAMWDAITYACAVERNNQTARRVMDFALDVGLATAIGVAMAVLVAYGV